MRAAPAARRAPRPHLGGGRRRSRARAVGALPPAGDAVGLTVRLVGRGAAGAAGRPSRPRRCPTPFERAAWVCEPTAPALVLGSTQRDEVADADACERPASTWSGAAAAGERCCVEPGRRPLDRRPAPRRRPALAGRRRPGVPWLGRAWAAALATLGVEARVHEGGLCTTQWSRLVCFGGLGTGEVVDADGRKLVGISQRRTRAGARFQCMAQPPGTPSAWSACWRCRPEDRLGAPIAAALRRRGRPVRLRTALRGRALRRPHPPRGPASRDQYSAQTMPRLALG